jgi:N-acetylglucosamine-6-sulfatase
MLGLRSGFIGFLASCACIAVADNTQKVLSSKGAPNVIFILTDDQDVQMDSLDYMPLVQKHLIAEGTHFKRHFCTVAVCCPSRVNIWTGKAAHNTNVTDIWLPYGREFH